MKRTLLLAAVLCLAFSPAWAQPHGSYLVLKGGFYSPQASDLDEFDNGLAVGIGFGTHIAPHAIFEFGIERFETDFSEMGVNLDFTLVPVTATIKGVHRTSGGSLYVGGGLGIYFVDADASVVGIGSGSDDDTAIGFHVLAGGNFNITPVIFLGGELKYFWVTPEIGGIDVDMDGFVATATLGVMF